MNKDNADYLKDRLYYLGFGDKLYSDLEKNLASKKDQFQISMEAEFNKGDKKQIVNYQLDFGKGKEDRYFLNKYQATLKHENPEEQKSHTFYINKGNGVTAKEAFNLLEGRSVFRKLTDKQDNPYEAWIQLDFNQKTDSGNHKEEKYHTAYGFDLDKTISKLAIKDLDNSDKKKEILKSLEKGNLHSVMFRRDDGLEKMFIEANPKERRVNVYDENMRKQFQGVKQHQGEKSVTTETGSQNIEKKTKDVTIDEPDAGKRKKKISVG